MDLIWLKYGLSGVLFSFGGSNKGFLGKDLLVLLGFWKVNPTLAVGHNLRESQPIAVEIGFLLVETAVLTHSHWFPHLTVLLIQQEQQRITNTTQQPRKKMKPTKTSKQKPTPNLSHPPKKTQKRTAAHPELQRSMWGADEFFLFGGGGC